MYLRLGITDAAVNVLAVLVVGVRDVTEPRLEAQRAGVVGAEPVDGQRNVGEGQALGNIIGHRDAHVHRQELRIPPAVRFKCSVKRVNYEPCIPVRGYQYMEGTL